MMDGQTTGRVTLFPDGKYRWIYEVNLFKNASTFYDVVKVIGLTLGLVYGMMLIMGIFVDNPEDYKFVLDYIRQLCPRVNNNLEKRNREKH